MPIMKNKSRNEWYGWRRELGDYRDLPYRPIAPTVAFPTKLLLGNLPKIYNQYSLGSCVGNATSSLHFYQQLRQHADAKAFYPSRLFIYRGARELEGSVNYDSGCYIRDAFKVMNRQGVCSENIWPYVISKYKLKPPASAYREALKSQVVSYRYLMQTLIDLKTCLFEGKPFVFGFSVYDGFESDAVTKTGVLQMPKADEIPLGGHAVLCVGWDDLSRRFIVQNSWGDDWGNKGYFTIPYEYILNRRLASDFWTMSLVEIP